MLLFDEFFQTVTGHKPFRWQSDVANSLCNNVWHDAIGIPPATGKTSILEIWYYSLYHNILTKPKARHIPLRLWYIVDRKVIVDGANESAVNLIEKLQTSLRDMGEVVKQHFRCDHPLFIGKIRGGMDRDEKNRWLTKPNQPTIITSTVDQYGSRLLFRGYGVNPKLRSIHAAMTGIDSLAILDEAHLSQALKSLLRVVAANSKPLGNIPSTKVIELTATGTNQDVFPINVADDPALAQRLNAKRNITLIRAGGNIVDTLLLHTIENAAKHNVLATICNTVMTARSVFNKLQKKKITSILLTGRTRPHEREQLYTKYMAQLLTKRDRTKDATLVVVSTQTIEVGADFDFDFMVSQASPLDCLIQRFGRLDRIGKIGQTEGIIVLDKKDDSVYGDVTKDTFNWLEQNCPASFDIGSIPRNSKYFAKTNHIPLFPKDVLRMLAHTHKSQQISLDGLLHGVKTRLDADFQIVYRNEITEDMLTKRPKEAAKWLTMNHSPNNAEILSLPVYSLYINDCADTMPDDDQVKSMALDKPCLRYRDGKVILMSEIRSGDLVIVPTSYGQYDEYGWNPKSTADVEDVSDHYSSIVRWHSDWTPGFNLNNYRSVDGNVEVEDILDRLSINTVSPRQMKHLPLLKKGFVRITPDGKGVYIYPARAKKDQEQQFLNAHNAKVGHNARVFCETIGLDDDLTAILEKSGQSHDLGKADPRFQEKLYYPNAVQPTLLAKSKGYNFAAKQRYPMGWRHELQSLVIAMENNLGNDLVDPELFYHIVAAHHGWFRSGIPIVADEGFKPFIVNDMKSSQAYFEVYAGMSRQSFYDLNEKYGYWGLAFLETILRLADWKN